MELSRTTSCGKRPVEMLGPNYLRSLTLLPDALAGLGATANLESVSWVEENRLVWDLNFTQDVIHYAVSTMDSLEEKGFFRFLSNLSGIEKELGSVLAAAPAQGVARFADPVEPILRPMLKAVSRFAPEKAYGTLLDTKNVLHQVELLDWGGENCVQHLAVLHEHLEELQLGSRLTDLKNLHFLLQVQRQRLEWYATHLSVKTNPGRRNVFVRLVSFLEVLDSESALEYRRLLVRIKQLFEELNKLQIVDLDH